MTKGELRALAAIGLEQASDELQAGFLHAYERMTNRRMGWIVYDMFSAEQVEEVRRMRQSGVSNTDVLAWMKRQMPVSYDELYESVMLLIVQEVELVHARAHDRAHARR